MSDTPETDAAWTAESGNGLNEVRELSRKLERERDEARKAAHSWRKLFFLMWAVSYDQPVPPDGKPPFPWEEAK